jgi:hypothetical protein
MPIIRSKDSKGPYFKFGATGKKYHYRPGSKLSKVHAEKKAATQGRAIERSKHMKGAGLIDMAAIWLANKFKK